MSTLETVHALGELYASVASTTSHPSPEAVCQDMGGFDKALIALEGLVIAAGVGLGGSKTIFHILNNPGHLSKKQRDYYNSQSTVPPSRSGLFDDPRQNSSHTLSPGIGITTPGRFREFRQHRREMREYRAAKATYDAAEAQRHGSGGNEPKKPVKRTHPEYAARRAGLYAALGSIGTAGGYAYYVANTGCHLF